MENAVALFGSFDSNIKLIEREFGVRIICRDSELKIDGDAENVAGAGKVIDSLLQFINRGEALSEQNVRYCISLVHEGSEDKIAEVVEMAKAAGNDGLLIEVDGGIGVKTVERVCAAGADVIVCGNAVYAADDPGTAIQEIEALGNAAREKALSARAVG